MSNAEAIQVLRDKVDSVSAIGSAALRDYDNHRELAQKCRLEYEDSIKIVQELNCTINILLKG